jgi:hypothetical protein
MRLVFFNAIWYSVFAIFAAALASLSTSFMIDIVYGEVISSTAKISVLSGAIIFGLVPFALLLIASITLAIYLHESLTVKPRSLILLNARHKDDAAKIRAKERFSWWRSVFTFALTFVSAVVSSIVATGLWARFFG